MAIISKERLPKGKAYRKITRRKVNLSGQKTVKVLLWEREQGKVKGAVGNASSKSENRFFSLSITISYGPLAPSKGNFTIKTSQMRRIKKFKTDLATPP